MDIEHCIFRGSGMWTERMVEFENWADRRRRSQFPKFAFNEALSVA